MKDDFTPAHSPNEGFLVTNISLNECYLIRTGRKIFSIAGGEIIKDGNLTAFCDQGFHQVRADETGPAGNESGIEIEFVDGINLREC